MISSYYIGRSQNIHDLRSASRAALSLPEFQNILWIGVFGSFARNQQGDRSDVDIVVIEKSSDGPEQSTVREIDSNSEAWSLEDLLPRVWCRPVQIIRIENNELRGLVSMDALLTARVIYGNSQSKEVLKLRHDARVYLDQGWSIFKTAETQIEILKSKADSLSGFEEFFESPALRDSMRDDLAHLLRGFDIKPTWHPIYEGFWSAVIQQADELKSIISGDQEDSEYWKSVWEILTASSPKTLQSILMRLKKFVFPSLTDIEERLRLSERLELAPVPEIAETAIELATPSIVVEPVQTGAEISTAIQHPEEGIVEPQTEAVRQAQQVGGTAEGRGLKHRLKRRLKKFKARLGL